MADYRDYQSSHQTVRGYDYDAGAAGGGVGALIALAVIVLFLAAILFFGTSATETTQPNAVAPIEQTQPASPTPTN